MGTLTGWERTDILAKILIGIAGLCLSVVLAWVEVSNRADENERKTYESDRMREDSYAREFQVYYKMARDADAGDELARSDLDIAGSIAQILAAKPFSRSFYSDGVVALRARLTSANGETQAPLRPGTLSSTAVQAREAGTAPGIGRSSEEWFAVIGSYSLNDTGLRLARTFVQSVSGSLGCAEIWRTRISQSYAVVLGGMTDRATALEAAQRARRLAATRDAFTQANRQWVQIEGGCRRGGELRWGLA